MPPPTPALPQFAFSQAPFLLQEEHQLHFKQLCLQSLGFFRLVFYCSSPSPFVLQLCAASQLKINLFSLYCQFQHSSRYYKRTYLVLFRLLTSRQRFRAMLLDPVQGPPHQLSLKTSPPVFFSIVFRKPIQSAV